MERQQVYKDYIPACMSFETPTYLLALAAHPANSLAYRLMELL